jgi:hypothetical protein
MFEHIEWLSQALCFTPLCGLLDCILILHFFFSWYRSAVKTGWKIDFWYLTLSLTVFPSLCILYPFNGSIYNNSFIHGHHEEILPFIDQAFLISVLGYLSLWMGRYLFDISGGRFPFRILFQLAEPFHRLVENNIKSRRAYLYVTFASLILGLLILCIQFKAECFFNARGWFLKQHGLRPLFNFTISLFPIAFAFLSLRYIQFKEKICLKFILILFVFSLFFGIRSLGLGGLLFLLTQWIFYRQGRFSLFKLLMMGCGLFACAVVLGSLREGNLNLLNSLAYFFTCLFYGNNFSDTRDFAWILTFWDGEYLYGKTYIAALISFIPRVLSSVREEWSISMYTNALTGFDSEVMPGLRPGFFGEAFLNFSYLGVICFGLLFGFALRYADDRIKSYVTASKDIIKGYSHLVVYSLVSCLSVSASMWAFYVFLLVNLALVLVRGKNTFDPVSHN